jgi:hypothetical protein
MTLDDILTEWHKDAIINDTDLDSLSQANSDIPKLHAKYLRIYTQENLSYKSLEKEFSKLKLEKTLFYQDGPT